MATLRIDTSRTLWIRQLLAALILENKDFQVFCDATR